MACRRIVRGLLRRVILGDERGEFVCLSVVVGVGLLDGDGCLPGVEGEGYLEKAMGCSSSY